MYLHSIEPVKIVSEHNGETRVVPDIAPRTTQAEVSYINQCCGLNLSAKEITDYLQKMAYNARPSTSSPDVIDVDIPPTRADVLHQADIMEDVAIAYGFNNLPRAFPSISGTIGQPLPINKLSDIVRTEAAMAGWSEALPLILCSHDENFAWLNRKDDGNTAVKLSNPKALEFQVVRTSLIPGLLKTIRENKHHTVPMKIFEVSDVAFKDLELERKSRNERHFAAAWYGKTSGFEVVHGLLDRIMAMLKSAFITAEEGLESTTGSDAQYWIEELNGMFICLLLFPSSSSSSFANILVPLQSLLTSLDTLLRCTCVSADKTMSSVLSVSSTLQYWRISSSSTQSALWRSTLSLSYKHYDGWSVLYEEIDEDMSGIKYQNRFLYTSLAMAVYFPPLQQALSNIPRRTCDSQGSQRSMG